MGNGSPTLESRLTDSLDGLHDQFVSIAYFIHKGNSKCFTVYLIDRKDFLQHRQNQATNEYRYNRTLLESEHPLNRHPTQALTFSSMIQRREMKRRSKVTKRQKVRRTSEMALRSAGGVGR